MDGSPVSSIDTPAPSTAWLMNMVNDENDVASMHFAVRTVQTTFEEAALKVSLPILTSICPSSKKATDSSVCLVKDIGGEKFAVLKRGLL